MTATSMVKPPQRRDMKIEQWPTDKLKPYGKNPRKNADAVAAVAESIEQFGLRQPIVVDGEGVIIAGHTRWLAAKKLKLERVPVHVVDLTPEQAKAYRIADNKTGELATWDLELLASELSDLQTTGRDLEALGFTADELGQLSGEAPSDGDWADAMEDDTSRVDGLRVISFTLDKGVHELLVSHLRTLDGNKNRAIEKWLTASS